MNMKKLILVTVSMLYLVALYAQHRPDDEQWLINDQGIQEENVWTGVNHNFTDVYLGGVDFPNKNIRNDDGQSIARNDFFVIFRDGTHYNGRYEIPNDQIHRILPTDPVASTNMGYFLSNNTGSQVEYLYLSNIYEGEDDLEFVSGGSNPNIQSLEDVALIRTAPSKEITANHDIVRDTDITLIFDLTKINRFIKHKLNGSGCTTFNLCFSVPDVNETAFEYDQITQSEVFNREAKMFMPTIDDVVASSDSCFSNITFDFTKPYAYLNLRMPQTIRFHRDQEMNFSLESTDGNCVFTHTEMIRNSHDPNFIKVNCVSEQCGYNIVSYHIECQNDGEDNATEVTLNLNLPHPFVENSIVPTLSSLGSLPEPNMSGNQVSFLMGDLGRGQSAYVDFCVKYVDIDVQTANLQPTYPYTTFGPDAYSINDFKDLTGGDIAPSGEDPIIYTTVIERDLTNDCGCGYQCKKWPCTWFNFKDKPVKPGVKQP